jgi:hypothetical protein
MGIYLEERASGGPPCGSSVHICGYVGLYAWRRERGREGEEEGEGERERERERGGGGVKREKQPSLSLGQKHWTSTAERLRQTHSTSEGAVEAAGEAAGERRREQGWSSLLPRLALRFPNAETWV